MFEMTNANEWLRQIVKYRNERVIYHHGGYPAYRSHVSFMPDKKVAVGVLVKGGRGKVSIVRYIFTLEYEIGREHDATAGVWK